MPSYVPAQYYSWVQTAASESGLPVPVVAAQIQEESGYDPNATSPTGAEGIAQFEPATFRSAGGHGSEYVAANELHPYITLTRQNLAWSGGNVEKALAAYNAGQGNWSAGIPYADTILSNSGQPNTLEVVPGSVQTAGLTLDTSGNSSGSGFSWSNPLSWIGLGGASVRDDLQRVGLIVFGGLMIIVGIFLLAGNKKIRVALKRGGHGNSAS